MKLNCSIVTYHTPEAELRAVLQRLRACPEVDRIYVIDNTRDNVGYGRGHNRAIEQSLKTGAEYHLVLNSDIEFTPGAISELLAYMESHPDVGHVMPRVLNPDGSDQHLAKRLPTPWDLIHRRLFHSHRLELELDPEKEWDVEYLSGCFMLLRTATLRQLIAEEGFVFDPRFFLYPEDLDLTRRIHRIARTVYLPRVTIVHRHRRASYHSFRMTLIHAREMAKYFIKWM